MNYSAHFQSEIFPGICWRYEIQKHIVTNGLGYLQVYAGADSGNSQNCHIVGKSSVGSDALLLVFVIDYAAGPGSCSHHTFPSPKKKQAGCKAGAVHRGPCWLF